MPKTPERCICGRERRAECPGCGKFVRVENGKLAAHEHGFCTGSHMLYRSCPKSGALAPTPTEHR